MTLSTSTGHTFQAAFPGSLRALHDSTLVLHIPLWLLHLASWRTHVPTPQEGTPFLFLLVSFAFHKVLS